MGKIKRTPTRKHLLSLPRYVRDFVRRTTADVALHDLPSHLDQFPAQWLFPRGDLHHWIPLLNRFDTILEAFVEHYQLKEGPQCKQFSRALLLGERAVERAVGLPPARSQHPTEQQLTDLGYADDGDRELIESVLRFTERLFEHCGSRSIYVSSSYLNSLLNTTSLSLVDATLRLCLQLAQRYSSARRSGDPSTTENLLQTYYQIDLKKLARLAQPAYERPKASQKPKSPEISNGAVTGEQPSIDYLELVDGNTLSDEDWQEVAFSHLELVKFSPTELQTTDSQAQSPSSPSPHGRSFAQNASASDETSQAGEEPSHKFGLVSKSWSKSIHVSYQRAPREVSLDAFSSAIPEELIEGTMALIPSASNLEKYEVLDQLRIARALLDSASSRQDLAATRLLAVANLAYIHSDHSLQEALQFESDAPRHMRLPHQLCKLVHPLGHGQHSVPKRFQTLAMRILTALCKHKSRINDVSTALNVTVNHGVLSFVTRKAVSELSVEIDVKNFQEDFDWRESIFGLLHELPRANPRNAEAIISAGLLEILVEALSYRSEKALLNHPRVLDFFDVFTYNKRETLRSLASANGLDAISDLLSHEVEVSLDAIKNGKVYPDEFKTRTVDFQIPYEHQQVLHSALNLIHHMVVNSQGAFDRQLRNIMESSQLLGALKTVILHPHEYGSTIWRDALQVFSNFLHSEPTSFGAMSEMGLNKAVLEVITGKPLPAEEDATSGDATVSHADTDGNQVVGFLPSATAITTLPDAISAICLNTAGLKQVQSSNVLGAFFKVFSSASHVRALADSSSEEQLEELGASFDELARHHPTLKSAIIQQVSGTTEILAQLLSESATKDRNEALLFHRHKHDQIISEAVRAEAALQRLSIPESSRPGQDQEGNPNPNTTEDVEMTDLPQPSEQLSVQGQKLNKAIYDPNQATASSSDYIGVFARFLYGFFSNTSHCQSFLETPAFERLLDIATCPDLPPDFNNSTSTTATRLILVFQVLIEQKAHLTLPSIISRALRTFESLSNFVDYSGKDPYFSPFLTDDSASLLPEERARKAEGRSVAQALVHVQTLCSILSKGLIPHSSRPSTSSLLSGVNLADMYMQLVKRVGKLLQRSTYENALLSTTIPPALKHRTSNGALPAETPASGLAIPSVMGGLETSGSNQQQTQPSDTEASYPSSTLRPNPDPKFQHRHGYSDADYNYACARHVVYNCPKTFTALLTTIGRALLPRRISMEPYPKQNTLAIADCVGEALVAQIPDIEQDTSESHGKALLAYYDHCITNIARSLTERRSEYDDWANAPILTLIVQSFNKRKGFRKLGDMLQSLVDKKTETSNIDERDKAAPRAGLTQPHSLILKLFDLVVNEKKIADAPQTSGLSARSDRERDKPDYFSSAQFAVELRYEATRSCLHIWNTEKSMERLDVSSVKILLRVLKHVLEANGEHGAFKRADKVMPTKELTRRAWRLRLTDSLSKLEERGYPKDLAMEALYRCNENSNAAAEYCQKYTNDPNAARNPIPSYDTTPLDVATSSATSDSKENDNTQSSEPGGAESVSLPSISDIIGNAAQPTSELPASSQSSAAVLDVTDNEDPTSPYKEPATVDDLDTMRTDLREDLIDKCLSLLYTFNDLTFELADLILASISKSPDAPAARLETCETLIHSIVSLEGSESQGSELQENSSRIEACAHMLGIILQDQEFFSAAIVGLKANFSNLIKFVIVPQETKPGEALSWIASILLVLERVLAEDAQPRQIQWTPPTTTNSSSDEPIAEVYEPMVSEENRIDLFDRLLKVLPRIGKDAKLGLAVVRALVPLTRTRSIATRLGSRKNLQGLFVMVKQLSGFIDDKFQTAFMIVLRHAIEDDATIRQIMRSEITMFFEKLNRAVDTTAYTRPLAHLIIRAPDVFVEVTNELVTMPRFDRNQNPQTLVLKKTTEDADVKTSEKNDGDETKIDSEQKMDLDRQEDSTKQAEPTFPVLENPDGIIHFMLSELLAYKDIDDKPANTGEKQTEKSKADNEEVESAQSSPDTNQTDKMVGVDKETFKAEDHPIFMYRALLLQSLTELLKSYTRTKLEFISYSRRSEPQSVTPSKPRSGVLNYLLNGIIPTGTLEHAQDVTSRKRSVISYWARQVVVGLCSRTVEKGTAKKRDESDTEDEPDLAYVRRFVLEHALKTFRDASVSSEPQEIKYSKMMCLSDVFNSLLAPKSEQNPPHRGLPDDQGMNILPTQKQIARMMYEKGYIVALNHAMSEMDLAYPHANRAVKYVLRPLKLLTSIAVELSQTMDASSSSGQTDEGEISSATSDTDYEEREETPDLFRNSTLGMFEPGREEESSEESEEDDDEDEEMYEDRYADDMEFEEEDDEDDVDEDDSDQDEEMGDAGPLEGLSGDVTMDVEIELDEEGDSDEDDLDDSSIDTDDSSEDDDEDDFDEDHAIDVEIEEEDDDDEIIHAHDDELASDEDVPHVGFSAAVPSAWGVVEDASDHNEGFASDNPLGDVIGEIAERAIDGDPDDDVEEESDDDGAGEDPEEDYDEEDVMFDGPDIDEDDIGGFPPLMSSRRHRHHHHHHHHHPFPFYRSHGMMDTHGDRHLYRVHNPRPGQGTSASNENSNPLLDRGQQRPTDGPHPTVPSQNERRFPPGFPMNFPGIRELSNLQRSIGDLSSLSTLIQALGGGPNILQAIQQHGAHTHGDGTVHLTLGPMPTNTSLTISQPPAARGVDPTGRSPRDTHNPFHALPFFPTPTVTRWQEEAKLLFGASFAEKGQKVINAILKLLVPPAIEAEKLRKEREAEQKRKDEEARKERELREEEERQEREALERARKEEEERQAAEAAAQAEQAARENTENMDVSTADRTVEGDEPASGGDAMEGIEAGPSSGADADSSSTAAQEDRPSVYITIRGRQVDIGNLGIDREYLEAIPEDMREEVIIQQVSEQRSQQRSAGEEPSAISQEFLEALPPEFREELLQQEAQDRRRQEREEARRNAATTGAQATAEDMDPASFITSLDPHLRQTVLAEADEETLARLPSYMLAEARALGGHRRTGIDPSRMLSGEMGLSEVLGSARARNRESQQQQESKVQRRPIIQMLDKSAVAGLLRLLFFNLTGNARINFNGTIQNASGNRQTRGEIVTGLLSILQDGSTDIQAAERSFSQLTIRARQASGSKTPQSSKKTENSSTPTETTPILVVGNCLSALVFLTMQVPHVSHFFLTEHDLSAVFKSKSSRKGKGKESKSSRYPINSLLVLLGRPLILQNSSLMETLAGLLHSVTHPLNALLKKDKDDSSGDAGLAPPAADNVDPSVTATEPVTASAVTSEPSNTEETRVTSNVAEEPAVTEDKQSSEKKARTLEAPEISEEHLRLVINILTARECSSKTFRDTLSVMTNLSAIPTARRVFGKELISRAQDLGQAIHKDLVQLVKSLHSVEDEMQAQSLALANFSPAGSDQAKLSRILTALDYLFEEKDKNDHKKSYFPQEGEDLLTGLIEDPAFSDLWQQLSSCLTATQTSDHYFFNVATILLPLIESLMVMCKRISLREPQQATTATSKDLASPTIGTPTETGIARVFLAFTNRHKKILNDLVRHNPKLMSGSFSVLVKNPTILEFDNKRNYFTRRLHHRSMDMRQYPHPSLQLNVRREQVFLDSYANLHYKSANEIKYGKLNIRFHNEEGVDAGGVTREWFQVLARQMFNADYALFNPVASDRTTFHPNPLSGVNPEHLQFFKFIGRIIGKALYENRVLDCHFSRAVYKRILAKPVSLKDMETIDLDYTKSMEWILENSIDDVISETFSIVVDRFGKEEEIDLMPDGRNIPVTDDNKHEYVRLIVEHKLTGAVKEQLDSFLSGFYDIVPLELVSIFDEGELELLISGMPDVDVEDWKNNTEYHNYNANSPQVQWFWRAVRSFDKEERARLLQFVTGTGKVPLNGFKELEGMNGFTRFNIHKDYGNKDRLPSSHTCFNQLDLPEYDNYEILRKQLYTAMTTGNEYFGFA